MKMYVVVGNPMACRGVISCHRDLKFHGDMQYHQRCIIGKESVEIP